VYNAKLDCQPFQLRPYSFLLIHARRNHNGIYQITSPRILFKEELVIGKDVDVNEHERLSNIALAHKL
jgi:hypothetical protein